MHCATYEMNSLEDYVFTIVFCRYKGKWLLCRHKERETWENAGGHIEPGESPLECAKRELYEETGALKYSIYEVCDYSAGGEGRSASAGVVFLADIAELGPLPESEMAETRLFETYPDNTTYDDITNSLLCRVQERMAHALEPVKLRPIRKEKVWGHEVWLLSMLPGEESVIEGGPFDGIRLDEYIARDPLGVMGPDFCESRRFPMLLKEIVAADRLSAQVHPSDALAPGLGKSELWYIADAESGAELIAGLAAGTDRATLELAGPEGVLPFMSRLPVSAGDAVNVPAGLVHAIGGGIRLLEVQQSSDVTYRFYDFGRGREIHWNQALEAADFNAAPETASGVERFSTELFDLNIIETGAEFILPSRGDGFYCVYCLEGAVTLKFTGGELETEQGCCTMVPASLSKELCNSFIKTSKKALTKGAAGGTIAIVAPISGAGK